jgi:outer membrane protein
MKRACLKIGGFFVLGILSSWAQEANSLKPRPAGLRFTLREADNSPTRQAGGLRFTLKEAEAYALQYHPQIASANLTAEAVRQEIREARSAFFPQVYAESDSVYEPYDRTRLAASGSLNTPSLFSHQADGFTASQLITDFGRTYELTESAHFRASAANARTNVARAMVVLTVDRSYFDVLRARAILRVANETIHARQVAFDQISTLTKNGLKSTLDSNFAQVNLSEAQLLQIQASSGVSEAEAELSTALGFSDAQHFDLVDVPLDTTLPRSPEALIQEAFNQRPELNSLRNELEASQSFAKAQDAAKYPKITALGAAGIVPLYPNNEHFNSTYYAAGVNIEIPVTNGGNLDALAEQAHFLARATAQNMVDAQNTISRDVRVAWLDANTARQRIGVTAQLVQAAGQAQNLADARYRLGTSSIVELIQAQLNYTQAELQDTSAKYDYQSGRALLNFTTGSSF